MKPLILALAAGSLLGSLQGAHRADDPLVGIWGMETTFGPTLSGELVVTQDGGGWRARIATSEARFTPAGDSIRFAFDGNMGEFRGVRMKGNAGIRGFWIQPPVPVLQNPFATPLALRADGANRWIGTVGPLPARYSLYLSVQRTASGALVAVFRNPEWNQNSRPQYRVARIGDSVIFTAGADTLRPSARVAGRLDSVGLQMPLVKGVTAAPNALWQLTLQWDPIGRLTLAPLTEAQAIGLFPRLPRGARYTYAPPPAQDDGWRTARASSAGFDEAKLASLVQRIADTIPTAPRAPLIHSMLVARHGVLVLEEYFYGYDRERLHDTRSAAKTLASIMLGAAMKRGAAVSPETRLETLMKAQQPFANPDPRKSRITLAHLMTHSSGLACDDNEEDSPGNEGTLQLQTAQLDWWKYMIDLPMKNDPGTYWGYCSGTMNLMSAALTNATGTWLPAFFEATIARPLNFGPWHYNLSPTLEGYLGGGVWLRPRDLLKLGQLYLDGGKWNGTQVVTPEWVTVSTSKKIAWAARGENVSAGSDGYAWHLGTLNANGREYRHYEANGNGGQFLIVVPELDLVVVFTGGNYVQGGVWSRWRGELVPNAIIPAIVR